MEAEQYREHDRAIVRLRANLDDLSYRMDKRDVETHEWRENVQNKMEEMTERLERIRGEISSYRHETALEQAHRYDEIERRIDNIHPLRKVGPDGLTWAKKLQILVYAGIIVGGAVAAYIQAEGELLRILLKND